MTSCAVPRHALRLGPALAASVLACLILTLWFGASRSSAQTTPITPSGLNTQVNLSATSPAGKVQYDITGGTRPGGGANLFHSFGEFGIPTNNIANFLNETRLPTSNILGRVTDGNISNIFGTIQTTGFGNANLFLMNPAGFLFGPNATVNVGGMVAFTTADYLRLSDGINNGYFYADPAGPSLLTAAPVAAFGFLGPNAASIAIQGGTLEVPDGKILSFIGGPRSFTTDSGVTVPSGVAMTAGRLSTPNGLVYMETVTAPGEIPLPSLSGNPMGSPVSFPGSENAIIRIQSGELVMKGASLLTATAGATTGAPIGVDIEVAGLYTMQNVSTLSSSTTGGGQGGAINVSASTLAMDASSIVSASSGQGTGGNVSVRVTGLDLSNGAQIVSDTTGTGKGGNITIDAAESLTLSRFDVDGTLSGVTTPFLFNPNTGAPLVASGIYSLTSGTTTATGGAITLTAPTVSLENGALVATITSGDGAGGNIAVTGATTVTLTGGASFLSSAGQNFSTSELSGSARGGDISITASDTVQILGGNADLFALSNISSQTSGSGDGGKVAIASPNIIVENAGMISSTSSGSGAGGNITIAALNQLSLSGFSEDFFTGSQISSDVSGAGTTPGGAITITGGSITIADSGVLSTTSRSPNRTAGALSLDVHDATLQRGGSIITQGLGDGSSGNLSIHATGSVSITGRFDIDRPSSIRNNVDESTVGANGGTSINAGRFELADGALIESGTGSQAHGGTHVIISAQESATISDRAVIAVVPDVGGGGSLEITAPTLTIANLVDIRSRALISNRDGGPIALNATAGDLTISGGSLIRNLTQSGPGNGGPVLLSASNSIFVTGGAHVESSSVVASGNAGVIDVIAGKLVSLSGTGSGLFTEASGIGNGGSIVVRSPQVQVANGAVISAKSTGSGAAGSVVIEGTSSPAQSVLVDGSGSGIFTDTQGTGAGGNIFVNANSVTLQNGGTFSAATSGTDTSATGGTITVNANQVHLNSGGLITASTTGAGAGGTITVDATNTVTMTGGAAITANSTGAANAGNINVTATNGLSMQNSSITTEVTPSDTGSSAGGGNITVTTSPEATVWLQNSTISASVADGPGGGGNISIDPQFVILQNSQILAQAARQGGMITITTSLFLPDANSTVSADSGSGLNGTVTIQSPNAPGSGKIQPLGKSPLQATSLLNQRCASLAGGEFSSFTVAGRDSLPTEPSSWLASPLATLSAGTGVAVRGQGERHVARGEGLEGETALLSLRQIAPAGFLTQAFAVDWSASCQS